MKPEEFIPHRPPFLMVDELLEVETGVKAIGVKRWKKEDPIFEGHFPGDPVVPGVLIIEAMGQVGAASVLSEERHKNKKVFLVKIQEAKFLKMVCPEDEVHFNTIVRYLKGGFGEGIGEAFVRGTKVAEGRIIFKVL